MKFKKWLSTGVTLVLALVVLWKIVPQTVSNFKNQGLILDSPEVLNLVSLETETLFMEKKNFVIFWASWCAPCKLEMNRVKRLIENGEVSAAKVLALNPFEDRLTVAKFLQNESYPFRFVDDNDHTAKMLGVKATPTFLWVADQKLIKMNTGIHLTGLFSLESFLKN